MKKADNLCFGGCNQQIQLPCVSIGGSRPSSASPLPELHTLRAQPAPAQAHL